MKYINWYRLFKHLKSEAFSCSFCIHWNNVDPLIAKTVQVAFIVPFSTVILTLISFTGTLVVVVFGAFKNKAIIC